MALPDEGYYDGHPIMPAVVYYFIFGSLIVSMLSTLFIFFSFATLLRNKSTQEQRQGLYIALNDTFMIVGGFLWASFRGVYMRNIVCNFYYFLLLVFISSINHSFSFSSLSLCLMFVSFSNSYSSSSSLFFLSLSLCFSILVRETLSIFRHFYLMNFFYSR